MFEKVKFRCLDFIYRHLFVAWGILVISTLTLLTGASIVGTIVGYTFGIGALSVIERLL